MAGTALFRLPYADHCTSLVQTTGEAEMLLSVAELNGRSGFVFAPFAPTTTEPVLLLRPDVVQQLPLDATALTVHHPTLSETMARKRDNRADYYIDYSNFHAQLQTGTFQKLVLARSVDVNRPSERTPLQLFLDACQRYPRMMIALVSMPQCGTWLMATPEVLLSGGQQEWLTTALAGTTAYADDIQWSAKNRAEQRFVATYITEQLEQFTGDFREEGPYTARAGHLAHLRSDFHFRLPDEQIGELLQALHPTPAVCGLPKDDAFRFILHNEHTPRSYYTGFCGPLRLDGVTHLYVSLRCMQLYKTVCRLYAGGGLLADSIEEQEWAETETKLDTMRNLL